MNIKEEIGNRIRNERKSKGITRKVLAELTDDLNISRINNYERGVRTPGPEEIKQLAKALAVSPAYLMCLTDEKQPKKIPGLGGVLPLLNHTQACDPIPHIQAMKRDDNLENMPFIPVDLESAKMLGENAFALKMEDESMLPELRVNDLLIIDPSRKPIPGGIIAVAMGDGDQIIIRRYRELSVSKSHHEYELIALNNDWANLRIDTINPIVGVVVSMIRHFL
ncbi:MAG: helix-turn-helix domain-containing protein [Legionellales bacterium]|nr:helix-turn-helix domain-containing protein [Legionellales bacterium]